MTPPVIPVEDQDAVWASIDWSRYTNQVPVHGRRVQYVDMGSGHPLVLLHGQGACWQWWLRNIPVLASRFRVIAIDLAGFGGSEPITTGPVMDGHVSTVTGLMDHLGLQTFSLVGHSMGGLVALEVASEYTDRLVELVLVDAGGSNLGKARLRLILRAFRMFNAVFTIPWVPWQVVRRPLLRRVLFAAAVADAHSVTETMAMQIVPRMATPGFVASMEAAVAAVQSVTPEDVVCPSLVVWGSRDRILPLSSGQLLAARLPRARLSVIEQAGHCVMFEAPEEFNRLLLDTVRADGQRPAG